MTVYISKIGFSLVELNISGMFTCNFEKIQSESVK